MNPDERPAKPPGLCWAIKRSFISYIAQLPDGRAVIDRCVTVIAGVGLIFPPAATCVFDTATGEGRLDFLGGAHFTGHAGLLSVRLTALSIEIAATAGAIMCETEPGRRQAIATCSMRFTADAHGCGWSGSDVRLASDSVALFGDAYQAGETLEPFTIFLPS